MKKIIFALFLFHAAFCLYAQTFGDVLADVDDTVDFFQYEGDYWAISEYPVDPIGLPLPEDGELVTDGEEAVVEEAVAEEAATSEETGGGEAVGEDVPPAGADDFADAPLPESSDRVKRKGFFGALLDYFDDPSMKTRHLERKRVVDIRLIHTGLTFGNNLLSATDILKKDIIIDLDKLSDSIDKDGVRFGLDMDMQALQLDINPVPGWGGGLGLGVMGRLDFSLPKGLLDFIAKGNAGNPVSEGKFTVSGSFFYELAFNFRARLPALNNKLSLGIEPAYFSPLLYIRRSEIGYKLDTDNKIKLEADGKFTAYTPVNSDNIQVGDLFKSGGVDLSLFAEYALFTRLDLGLTVSHIPLVSASLNTGLEYTVSLTPVEINDITSGDFGNLIDMNIDEGEFGPLSPINGIRRPLRFDFYTIFRPLPFGGDLFSIRSNVGFTTLNASEETYLNFGGRLSLQFGRVFVLYFDTGLEEDFWRHKLGFELNLRVFELNLEGGVRSQNYAASWAGSGLSVKLGLAFGF